MLVTIVLGLTSRSGSIPLPENVIAYAGDTLWAMMIVWLVSTLRPQWQTVNIALISLAFAFTIEFTQLYQAPWINEIRAYGPGGLILGFGFKLSDLACYMAGVLSASVIRWLLDHLFFASAAPHR
jgi:hypothetical protein